MKWYQFQDCFGTGSIWTMLSGPRWNCGVLCRAGVELNDPDESLSTQHVLYCSEIPSASSIQLSL